MNSTHTAPEQRPARPASLPLADLARWLMGQGVLDAGQTLQAERITGGQSNPSWLLRSGSRVLVLRAKPAPAAQLLPSAHAIER